MSLLVSKYVVLDYVKGNIATFINDSTSVNDQHRISHIKKYGLKDGVEAPKSLITRGLIMRPLRFPSLVGSITVFRDYPPWGVRTSKF